MSSVTLQLKSPAMRGTTVKEFQKDVKAAFKRLGIDAPINIDGIYVLPCAVSLLLFFGRTVVTLLCS